MSLYDDFEAVKQKSDQVAGWSSGIKLFQSQLQLKKAAQTLPKREQIRKAALAPVFDLKEKKDDEDTSSSSLYNIYQMPKESKGIFTPQRHVPPDMDWDFHGVEYDPMWPNDYDKVVLELRDLREKEREKEDEERRKKRDESRVRINNGDSDEEEPIVPTTPSRAGVAIAPPPSLQESTPVIEASARPPSTPNLGGSIAAKIMAKYGFKEGQGLGKKEQGISMALQVEKTSKRGGRIIHEKDIMPPPPLNADTPPRSGSPSFAAPLPVKPEPSITEIMKSPSKVVLLRNMVGPGEVDQELEPEVKDECNTKYGDVVRVLIYERPEVPPEEAVRIFVEFKRIESAIKAVVDLNGRFFGGRQVKAGFYNYDNFNSLKLLD